MGKIQFFTREKYVSIRWFLNESKKYNSYNIMSDKEKLGYWKRLPFAFFSFFVYQPAHQYCRNTRARFLSKIGRIDLV